MSEEESSLLPILSTPSEPPLSPSRHSALSYVLVWLGWVLVTAAIGSLSTVWLPLLLAIGPLQGLPLCVVLGRLGARRRIVIRWTLASLAGEILGIAPAIGVSFVTAFIAYLIIGDPYSSLDFWGTSGLALAGLAFSCALVTSTLRWRFVRPWFKVSGLWVWINAFSWAAAVLIGTRVSSYFSLDELGQWLVGSVVAGAIAGLLGGGVFLLLLRRAEKATLPTEEPANLLGLLRSPARLFSFLRTELSPKRRGKIAVRRLAVLLFLVIWLLSTLVIQGRSWLVSRGTFVRWEHVGFPEAEARPVRLLLGNAGEVLAETGDGALYQWAYSYTWYKVTAPSGAPPAYEVYCRPGPDAAVSVPTPPGRPISQIERTCGDPDSDTHYAFVLTEEGEIYTWRHVYHSDMPLFDLFGTLVRMAFPGFILSILFYSVCMSRIRSRMCYPAG